MSSNLIRPIRVHDVKEVIAIEEQSFPEPWGAGVFMRLALGAGHLFLDSNAELDFHVLEREGTIIGYVAWESSFATGRGHILNLAVREDQRRRGHASRLLEFTLQRMREKNIKTVFLEARENNMAARRLYEAHGMTASDRIRDYYGTTDAIIYTMNL